MLQEVRIGYNQLLRAHSSTLLILYSLQTFLAKDISIDGSGKFQYISLRLVLLNSYKVPLSNEEGFRFTKVIAIEYTEWFINNCKELRHLYISKIYCKQTFFHYILYKLFIDIYFKGKKNLYIDILTSCLMFSVK
jgi:hypothetical protein